MTSSNLTAREILLPIVALWSFAVAQPLFDLMIRHPAFITAHEITLSGVVALCLGLSIVAPVVLGSAFIVLRNLLPRSWVGLFYGCMAVLVVFMLAPIVWRLAIPFPVQLLVIALATGALALLYRRIPATSNLSLIHI